MLSAIKTAYFTHQSQGHVSQVSARLDSNRQDEPPGQSISAARLALGLVLSDQRSEAGSEKTPTVALYQTIAERNAFGLKPAPPVLPPSQPILEPKQDLLLTGVTSLGNKRLAFFMVEEPGQLPLYFTLAEGQQNDWLEVRSIDSQLGTVKALLKKPVMRIRSVGAEVILSFQAHGAKN